MLILISPDLSVVVKIQGLVVRIVNKEYRFYYMQEEREKLARSETTAIQLSNIANMVLFAAKVYASVRSGSLAIIASTLDSLLDLLSGFILWFTAFSMQTPNPYQYPIGKKRMQPLVSHFQPFIMFFNTTRCILVAFQCIACCILVDLHGQAFHTLTPQLLGKFSSGLPGLPRLLLS